MRGNFIPRSDAFKKKMKERMQGEKNPMWRGGYDRDFGGKDKWWKKEVLKLDNYTCRVCGLRDLSKGFLQVDHIKPKSTFPKLKFEISNGQVLCPNCHRRKTITEMEKYGWFSKKK